MKGRWNFKSDIVDRYVRCYPAYFRSILEGLPFERSTRDIPLILVFSHGTDQIAEQLLLLLLLDLHDIQEKMHALFV